MKLNKTKFLIPSLAIVAGACLVGSVSGTVAWYQYSTRVTAAILGTSVKCSDMLEIQAKNTDDNNATGFSTNLRQADMTAAAPSSTFKPVTYSATQTANGALSNGEFKKNPVFKSFAAASWRTAAAADYVQFKLDFHSLAVDGGTNYVSKKHLYLTNLTIQKHGDATADLSDAIRVHITDGTTSVLLGKVSTNEANANVTDLHGYLDLNGDGEYDGTRLYEWENDAGVTEYGVADGTQTLALNKTGDGGAIATIAADGTVSGGTDFGAITAAEVGKTLIVTVWLEGWAKLDAANAAIGTKTAEELAAIKAAGTAKSGDTYLNSTDSNKPYRYNGTDFVDVSNVKDAVWDTKYQGKMFDVGFEFAVNPSDGVNEA